MPGNNVQKFRESLMMSKAELARKAGLSTLTIDRIEAGLQQGDLTGSGDDARIRHRKCNRRILLRTRPRSGGR